MEPFRPAVELMLAQFMLEGDASMHAVFNRRVNGEVTIGIGSQP